MEGKHKISQAEIK